MSDDYLNYEHLFEEALRAVIRKALAQVAEQGLHDGHYFQITFRTDHPGVDVPPQLRLQYPDEMPIILQNAFWDLEVGELGFSVGLSFNRVQQRLTIPFDAITIFDDPHPETPFRLQFQAKGEAVEEEAQAPDAPTAEDSPAKAGGDAEDGSRPAEGGDSDKLPAGDGAEIVTLDTFRKK